MAKIPHFPGKALPDPRLAHPVNELTKTTCVLKSNMPNGMINYLDMVVEPTDDPESASFNQMRLERMSRVYSLERYRVTASIDEQQIEFLNKMHGIDAREQLKSTLFNEDSISLEKKILGMYNDLGTKTSESMLTPRQLWFRKYFKNMKFPTFIYSEKGQDVSRMLISKLLVSSNVIATKSRRGPANFAIVSPQVASLIQDSAGFMFGEMNGTVVNNMGAVYPVGSVAGIKVLVDPYMKWEENSLLTGRTTKDGEPGMYLIEGDNELGRGFEEIQFFDSPPGQTKLCLGTRRAILTTPGAENCYMKLDISFKKKPWWRKLFKI